LTTLTSSSRMHVPSLVSIGVVRIRDFVNVTESQTDSSFNIEIEMDTPVISLRWNAQKSDKSFW
jgi:hypothetical protein